MQKDIIEKCSENKKIYIYEQLAKDKENDDFVKSSIEKDFELFEERNKKRALSILLAKGSMYGLKYFVNHIDAIEYHIAMHYTNIEALPYMLEAYSKAIDIQSRLNYSFIMNSIEELVLVSNENWQKVKIEFGKLIDLNRKKYVHLNFYLDKWEKEIMEKCTPTIGIKDVICLLKTVQSN